ncbi:MAG TPA: hypothetical protein VFP81_08665 [Propionibacteriaceae bacterium]|nr:hypothetical protein [Propionibacteriaceae bacterium]
MELPFRLFTGPDGTLLELIARHELAAPASSGRFSSADLRISEIGLAVPDVPAAVASLQNAFGLPVLAPLRPSSLRSAIPTGS